MDAVDRADVHAGRVLGADTRLANDIGHGSYYSHTAVTDDTRRVDPVSLRSARRARPARRTCRRGPLSMAGGRVVIGTDVSVATSTTNDDVRLVQLHRLRTQHDADVAPGRDRRLRVNDHMSFLAETAQRERRHASGRTRCMCGCGRGSDARSTSRPGRIPPTFGAFSRRAYANGNPLIGYPLAYQYLTSLRPDAVPRQRRRVVAHARARMAAELSELGRSDHRHRHAADHRISMGHRRRRCASVPRVSQRQRRRSPTAPCPIRAPTTTTAASRSPARLQWRAGRRLGARRVRGARPLSGGPAWRGIAWAAPHRRTSRRSGSTRNISRDHWLVRGEGIWNRWQMPTIARPLDATSAIRRRHVQGVARLSSRRAGSIISASAADVAVARQTRTWDAPVTRAGKRASAYYVRRNLLAQRARISTTGATAA